MFIVSVWFYEIQILFQTGLTPDYFDFSAVPEEGTNGIDLRTEAFVSAGSGSRLLRVLRILSKEYLNPVNPIRHFFFIRPKCYCQFNSKQEARDLF